MHGRGRELLHLHGNLSKFLAPVEMRDVRPLVSDEMPVGREDLYERCAIPGIDRLRIPLAESSDGESAFHLNRVVGHGGILPQSQ
jgi:hypothetical protein